MITLKKAKLIDQIEVYCEYEEKVMIYDKPKYITKTFCLIQEPHLDLINALDELKVHLAGLCEIMPMSDINLTDKEYLNDLRYMSLKVTGISLGGSDEHSGVTLIGRKTLRNNRVLNLVAPFTKFEEENEPYKYQYELSVCVSNLEQEFIAYMNGKYAPSKQLELTL